MIRGVKAWRGTYECYIDEGNSLDTLTGYGMGATDPGDITLTFGALGSQLSGTIQIDDATPSVSVDGGPQRIRFSFTGTSTLTPAIAGT